MSEPVQVRATLEPRGPAAAVILADEQVAALGGGKTPPVRFTVAGTTIEGRIGRMGGENLMGFNKAVRAQLGVEAGDVIDVEIVLDDAPRAVEVPPALEAELAAHPGARAAWEALAPSRRKEHARSIADAKQDSTRQRRVEKAMQELLSD
jgi:ribosomal protein L11